MMLVQIQRNALGFLFCTTALLASCASGEATTSGKTPSTDANANLSALQLVTGTLSPTFDPSVTSYEGELLDSGATVAVTATAEDGDSTIRVQDKILLSGATTDAIAVRPATMSLTIDVEAADALTHKTYSVVVRLKGWQLDETNTGLAGAGIDKNTLPVYDGPLVGGIWHEPPSGSVISLKRIDHPLSLTKGNITIDRCWIRPTRLLPASFVYTFDFNNGNPGADTSTIVDSDIDGTLLADQEAAAQCAVDGLATVQRTNMFSMGTGIAVFAFGLNRNIAVEQNFVHDLRKYGDPATGSHNESFTIRGFVGSSLQIRNNHFVSKTGNDSGAIFIQPYADAIDNTLIEGNLLETYGWCIPLMTQNHDYGTNMRARDNRFVELGYGPGYVQGGPGWALWEDNYYDDPSVPAHKGRVANQPR
jgi:hypothetical protein